MELKSARTGQWLVWKIAKRDDGAIMATQHPPLLDGTPNLSADIAQIGPFASAEHAEDHLIRSGVQVAFIFIDDELVPF